MRVWRTLLLLPLVLVFRDEMPESALGKTVVVLGKTAVLLGKTAVLLRAPRNSF